MYVCESIGFSVSANFKSAGEHHFHLMWPMFELEFYCLVNTVKIMLRQSFNLLTLFSGRICLLLQWLTSTCAYNLANNSQLPCFRGRGRMIVEMIS